MHSTSEIRVELISKSWSDEAALAKTIAAYRELRLYALQHDPNAFGSNYAREVQFSDEAWRKRLLSDNVSQVAALHLNNGEKVKHAAPEWLGMVMAVRCKPEQPAEDEFYMLNGMFVHPSVRRQGLGRRLIKRAIDAAIVDRIERRNAPVRIDIIADAENEAAISLYKKCGFTFGEESSGSGYSGEVRGILWVKNAEQTKDSSKCSSTCMRSQPGDPKARLGL